jgi:hypothetical protein
MATPAITDGLLIFRSQHHVFAVAETAARSSAVGK